MSLIQSVTTACVVGSLAAHAGAAITITGSGASHSVTAGSAPGKWIVTIDATTPQTSGSVPRLTLSGASSDVIELLQINNSTAGNTHVELTIGGGLTQNPLAGIEDIAISNPATTRFGFHDLKFAGDLGVAGSGNTMTVNWANYIWVGGDWYANFVIDGNQTANQESLVIDGDILEGGIYNNVGRFKDIQVQGVISGPSLDPVEIWSATEIQYVRADDMSEVRIGSQTAGFSGFTEVGYIQVLGGGDFVSSAPMTMDSLDYLNIGGNFDADITVNSALSSTQASRIEGDFASTAILSLPSNGLPGSIRINAAGGSGQFLGDIDVGSTTINANYTTLSQDIGNGAAGAAPFNFHQFAGPLGSGDVRDCNPFHTEFRAVDICDEPTRVDEVVIDHYGPVHTNGTGPYYRIEFRPAFLDPNGPTWFDVSSQFQVDTTRTSSSPTESNRKVYIIPKDQDNGFNAAGIFRFRPLVAEGEGNKVRCSNVYGSPNVAYQSSVVSGDLGSTTGTQHHWYQFRVGLLYPDCESSSMLFENDRVNASDLTAWVNNPFEVNMDGQICTQDFALMTSAYEPE